MDNTTIAVLLVLAAVVFFGIYVASVAWAIGDAEKRGLSGGPILLLFYVAGPLGALIWLLTRPTKKLEAATPKDFDNADDALAAASRLDALGEWDRAVSLYQSSAARWPEHETYATNCIERIHQKKSLA